jgi:hypothetical protein
MSLETSLITKLRPGHVTATPRVFAILANLLGQSWTPKPIFGLSIASGYLIGDGQVLGTIDDIYRALDLVGQRAGLTEIEGRHLRQLLNRNQFDGVRMGLRQGKLSSANRHSMQVGP